MTPEPIQHILEWIEINRNLVYFLLFCYCALKSGALPLFAGLVASTGALEVQLVTIASFMGGYLGDELRFYLARRYGERLWHSRPRVKKAVAQASELMNRYGARYIFLYRYPKGMRTVGALPVGLSAMEWQKFTILNAGSALLWVFILVGFGFVFGERIQGFIVGSWTILTVSLLGAFAAYSYYLYRRHFGNLATEWGRKD